MSTENIVSGKKYRILTDAINKVYDRISFWCKASDVEFNSGSNAQTTLGSITGISDSLTSTSSNVAASAYAVKQLNDKITKLNSNLIKGNVVSNTSAQSTSAHAVSITVPNIKSAILIVTLGEWKAGNGHTFTVSGADSLTLLDRTDGNGTCKSVTAIYKASVTPGATITLNVPNSTSYLSSSIALVY